MRFVSSLAADALAVRPLDMTVENADVIDLVAHDPLTDEVLLVMVEVRPWGDGGGLLPELQNKFSAYLTYALDGQLTSDYPTVADKRVRFELRCAEPPGPKEVAFLTIVERQHLEPERITFRWQILDSNVS